MTERPAPLDRKPVLDRDRKIVLRDLAIFQVKLLLDGIKDIILVPVSILAAGLDILLPTKRRGARFYAVMTAGEKFDNWLNLFGASTQAATNVEGLFGASRAGADSLLGRIEEIVLGHREDEKPADPEAEAADREKSASQS